MTDSVLSTVALVAVLVIGAMSLGIATASAARDAHWWVLARGVVGGRYARIRGRVTGTNRT